MGRLGKNDHDGDVTISGNITARGDGLTTVTVAAINALDNGPATLVADSHSGQVSMVLLRE
ncbi:MAG: hypothetical protein IID32_08350, partial [Planctomycetes bacterium]|nr:hypothetical protein [Planctomycetota bacterium]